MDLFFNELSLKTASNRHAAAEWFQSLGDLYKIASARGLGEIKVPASFLHHPFTDEYTFFQWASDRDFDQDLRTLLKSRITTTPLIEEMLGVKESDTGKVFDCRYEQQLAIGLGAASHYMYDALAISMSTDSIWDQWEVPVDISVFDGDTLEEEQCVVKNIFKISHFDMHEIWLKEKNRPHIPNGNILWLKRSAIFPNLIFCEHVKSQIAKFSGNQPDFVQAQKRLFELEAYAAKRTAGIFRSEELPSKVTPESETRSNTKSNELYQLCPDGATRFFDWHSRFTPGAGRIHFFPLEDSNKIIIGSIANQNEIK
jgi:hypothetical protein